MSVPIQEAVYQALTELYPDAGIILEDIQVQTPPNPEMGDLAVPLFPIAKKALQSPQDIADQVSKICAQNENFTKVEAISGFVNFWMKKDYLYAPIEKILHNPEQAGHSNLLSGKKLMVEFAHPNTHKPFHIGHLRNLMIGESLVRILESCSATVFRANYQGDVGPHVAKCLWAVRNADKEGLYKKCQSCGTDLDHIRERAEFLGRMYATGAQTAKKDLQAEAEIKELNIQIYQRDPLIMPLWEETRNWSLEYFDKAVYQRFGSHFDRLFMESEVWERGLEIARELLEKGILIESEGAVVFPGDEYDLHRRVFITSAGTATYEAKELGLSELQKKALEFDQNIHVVGNEQAGYFDVIFKVLELQDDWQKGRQMTLNYGMVNLKSGKMSSRTGEVITAEWLLDEVKKRIYEKLVENKTLKDEEKADIAEKVAMAALKFSFLRTGSHKNIAFDFDTSLSFTGDSGPYLQYAHARISSILREVSGIDHNQADLSQLGEPAEKALAQELDRYGSVVEKAAQRKDPSVICNYLLDLAQDFSSFYSACPVLKADDEIKKARLALCRATQIVLASGLNLIGIAAPDKM